jgi:acetophenone carboxylase
VKVRITEYLDIDLTKGVWCCNRCGYELCSATDNYKHGCLIDDRDPRSIYQPIIEGSFTFSPDPEWIRIVEYYCPECGIMIENEFLPPGHPLTHDIELDIEALRRAKETSRP